MQIFSILPRDYTIIYRCILGASKEGQLMIRKSYGAHLSFEKYCSALPFQRVEDISKSSHTIH